MLELLRGILVLLVAPVAAVVLADCYFYFWMMIATFKPAAPGWTFFRSIIERPWAGALVLAAWVTVLICVVFQRDHTID